MNALKSLSTLGLTALALSVFAQTRTYENAFKRIGKTDAEVQKRVDATFQQLFHGDDANQRIYYPVGTDEAYILDVGNKDVRSEGMSYGMMISVQMGRKTEFDRIWKWAKTHMQHQTGPWKGTFAWQCKTDGTHIARFPASDGEEYFAMALFFAAGRWGNGKGIFDYKAEANAILNTMLHKEQENDGVKDGATNIFNADQKQVVFVPYGDAAKFTDPSYHLPAFYELWSQYAAKDRDFWKLAATTSRAFFHKAAHPETGLFPDYSSFEGKAMKPPWDANSSANNFNFDAWRVAMNITLDHHWFKKDPWQPQALDRILAFFRKEGINDYKAPYELGGKATATYRSEGLIAMNAVAATASSEPTNKEFLTGLWNQATPAGQWRYYNGMLHMFALLHCSGNYRIYAPK